MSNNYNKSFENQSGISTKSINATTLNNKLISNILYVDVSNNITVNNLSATYLNNKPVISGIY